MASVMTIQGYDGELGAYKGECRCTRNGRTLCRVTKSKKHPSGWTFVKASDPRAKRCKR